MMKWTSLRFTLSSLYDFQIMFLVFFTMLSPVITRADNNPDQSLQELKDLLHSREEYTDRKEKKITEAKVSLRNSGAFPEQKFRLQRAVFDLYLDYQLDSALVYAQRMLHLSDEKLLALPEYKAEALLLIARVYSITGKYDECAKILADGIFSTNTFSNRLKERYFTVQLALNRGLFEIRHERENALFGIQSSLDSLVAYTPRQSKSYPINLSNKFRAEEDYDSALATLLDFYPKLTMDDPEKGTVAYFISLLYRLKGNKELGKKFLISSGIIDLKSGKKAYTSLWELAPLLSEEGNIEMAHRFIEVSLQDAMYSGAYRWTLKIQKILPKIYKDYNDKILQQRNAIFSGFLIIILLLVVTVLLSSYLIKQYKRLQKTKKQLSDVNEDLKTMNTELNSLSNELLLSNAELQVVNSQLVVSNNKLISTSLLKETYLSKFIDLCSVYIDKLDDYRSDLNRLLKNNYIEKAKHKVQSKQHIEDEIKSFILNFDETFLKIYPNFVEEYNNLLLEEGKQYPKKTELLTTELRIFALIRLGITDSAQIARFLRCSITTVYTYRSKAKNKSFYPEQFEERIREHDREDVLLNCSSIRYSH